MFDEFEEWHLIQAHYCFTVGINNGSGVLDGVDFLKIQSEILSLPFKSPVISNVNKNIETK